jgi:hypothetical protein
LRAAPHRYRDLPLVHQAGERTNRAGTVNTHFIGKSMILILFLRLVGRVRSMTKSATVEVQRQHAERQLFGARRALAHLVEMYDTGQWRHYYKKEEAFAEAVRDARQVVEQWTDIVNQISGGTS